MDIESWEKLLDDRPNDFTSRLVYADWLEEQGLLSQATSQRWMGTHHKWPKRTRSQRIWDSLTRHNARFAPWKWYHQGEGRYASATLPQAIYYAFRDLRYHTFPCHPNAHSICFWSRQEAELALSQALTRLPHAP